MKLVEAHIRSILEIRRRRSAAFGSDLFSDPAWDILLELLAAELGRREVRLSDLTSIGRPSTIARWVAALEQRGLIIGALNPLQPHDFGLKLSRRGAEKLKRFLSDAPHFAPLD